MGKLGTVSKGWIMHLLRRMVHITIVEDTMNGTGKSTCSSTNVSAFVQIFLLAGCHVTICSRFTSCTSMDVLSLPLVAGKPLFVLESLYVEVFQSFGC